MSSFSHYSIIFLHSFLYFSLAEPRTQSNILDERFTKIVNDQKPLTIFTSRSILDVWQGSKYASADF